MVAVALEERERREMGAGLSTGACCGEAMGTSLSTGACCSDCNCCESRFLVKNPNPWSGKSPGSNRNAWSERSSQDEEVRSRLTRAVHSAPSPHFGVNAHQRLPARSPSPPSSPHGYRQSPGKRSPSPTQAGGREETRHRADLSYAPSPGVYCITWIIPS